MDLQKQYPCDISPFYNDNRELYIPERGQHLILRFLDCSLSFIVLFCFCFVTTTVSSLISVEEGKAASRSVSDKIPNIL